MPATVIHTWKNTLPVIFTSSQTHLICQKTMLY